MKTFSRVSQIAGLSLGLALAGCAAQPNGPGVMALPGSHSSFEQFQGDDARCRSYAGSGSGGAAAGTARQAAVDSAVVGTMVGAAAGALIGGASGDAGQGAAVGAGSGLLIGSSAGASAYQASGAGAQERYDMAYVQCMYGAGHQVPLPASAAALAAPRPSGRPMPVPPAGLPPPNTPPPPGY